VIVHVAVSTLPRIKAPKVRFWRRFGVMSREYQQPPGQQSDQH
jgi:hypothetical protein